MTDARFSKLISQAARYDLTLALRQKFLRLLLCDADELQRLAQNVERREPLPFDPLKLRAERGDPQQRVSARVVVEIRETAPEPELAAGSFQAASPWSMKTAENEMRSSLTRRPQSTEVASNRPSRGRSQCPGGTGVSSGTLTTPL